MAYIFDQVRISMRCTRCGMATGECQGDAQASASVAAEISMGHKSNDQQKYVFPCLPVFPHSQICSINTINFNDFGIAWKHSAWLALRLRYSSTRTTSMAVQYPLKHLRIENTRL
jgi:hypothetical protein